MENERKGGVKLSIVVPAHNEDENIASVIEQIESNINLPHELVVVNDHSSDRTKEIVSKLTSKYSSLRLIENELEKGFANAVKTGLINSSGDAVIPVMGDLCDDLSSVPKMFDKIGDGFDIVCGARYIKGGQRCGGPKIKAFFSCLAGWSAHYLLGLPTHDMANAFKMYRRKVIESVDIKSRGFEISMEITLKAFYQGFRITEVPTIWNERTKGKSSFKIMKLLPSYLKLYWWAIGKKLTGFVIATARRSRSRKQSRF